MDQLGGKSFYPVLLEPRFESHYPVLNLHVYAW